MVLHWARSFLLLAMPGLFVVWSQNLAALSSTAARPFSIPQYRVKSLPKPPKLGALQAINHNAIDKPQNSDALQTCKKESRCLGWVKGKPERAASHSRNSLITQTLEMQRITLWGFSVPESHLSASTQSIMMPGESHCISVALSRYRRDTAMRNWQGSIATFYVAGCVFGCAAVSDFAAGVEGFQGLGLLVVRLGERFSDTQLSIAWLCCGLVSLGC